MFHRSGALETPDPRRGFGRADPESVRNEWDARRGRGPYGAGAAEVDDAMKQLIEDIVKALVDRPEEVQIKEVVGDHAHVLELRVSKDDLGKVIGKGGAHASAIRTLMAAASGKEKKRYILEIIEY